MDTRNVRNQAPWPEDFDIALNAREKALENKTPARSWRPRLLFVAKVLAIIAFLLVWFTLALPSGRF